jgi:hypothetical protein
MSERKRKSLIVQRASAVPETSDIADGVTDALKQLGRAICCLAVKVEARNPGEQRELAAIMWSDCVNDFRDVPTSEEMRNWLAGLMKIDPRTMPRRPYGK